MRFEPAIKCTTHKNKYGWIASDVRGVAYFVQEVLDSSNEWARGMSGIL